MRISGNVKKVRKLFQRTSPSFEVGELPANIDAMDFIDVSTHTDTQKVFYPRASGLYKGCILQHILGMKYKKIQNRYVGFKQRITFGKGNAYHWWMQNTSDLFGDKIVGNWRCFSCGKLRKFGVKPTTKCEHCSANPEATFYDEYELKIKDPFYLTGHPDLFLRRDKTLYLAELKSMAYSTFETLAAPLIEHRWQILAYLIGLEADKKAPKGIDTRMGIAVYVSKAEAKKAFPVKIFPVYRDEYIVEQIHAKLDLFKNGVKDFPNNLPDPDPKCVGSNWDSYQARICPVINECIKHCREG